MGTRFRQAFRCGGAAAAIAQSGRAARAPLLRRGDALVIDTRFSEERLFSNVSGHADGEAPRARADLKVPLQTRLAGPLPDATLRSGLALGLRHRHARKKLRGIGLACCEA